MSDNNKSRTSKIQIAKQLDDLEVRLNDKFTGINNEIQEVIKSILELSVTLMQRRDA